jgi:hypothetical protein
MEVREALGSLLTSNREWRRFFADCCRHGHRRLRSQAWQFADELAERGPRFRLPDVEDALAVLAAEVLPDSPAGAWDEEWAHELMRGALAYVVRWIPEGGTLPYADDHPIAVAELARDRLAYREAVREWTRATLRALKGAGERDVA